MSTVQAPMVERRLGSVELNGVRLSRRGLDDTTRQILALAESHHGGRAPVVTMNLQHLRLIRGSEEFRSAYRAARFITIDGSPIAALVRMSGQGPVSRAPGSDLVVELCREAAVRGLAVQFVGGQPGAAARASERMTSLFPSLITRSPLCPRIATPGTEDDADRRESRSTVAQIRREAAPIVFLGLGSPKQEMWAAKHRDQMGDGVIVCVGAGIDFAAGMARRAPRWAKRAGLEWMHRMAGDPRRLGPRYARDAVVLARGAAGIGKRIIGRGLRSPQRSSVGLRG